jgi:hypothetical protein
MGVIEAQPGATKLTIQNNSRVQLLNVKWNGINFGNINSGEISEKEVSTGQGLYVYFEVGNNKRYRTWNYISAEKYRHGKFTFIDNTSIIDSENSNSNFILLGGVLNAD